MENISQILNQRAKTHGDFTYQAGYSQYLKSIIRLAKLELGTNLTPNQTEALEMILHKVSRILCGNPNEVDHWRDIAGYAQLVINRLEKSLNE